MRLFKTPSYLIKFKLSIFLAISYIVAIVAAYICTPKIFWASNHANYSLLYSFGILAWSLSAILLKKEYKL